MNKPTSHGFTLVELIVTLAIVAIVATIAVPSFQEMLTKNRVKGAAEAIYSDMQLARQESIKRNSVISVTFGSNSGGWCYGLDDASGSCDCTAATSASNCTIGSGTTAFSKVVQGATNFNGVALTSSNITFDNVRGTATTTGTNTVSVGSYQASVVVGALGSVRICTPSGQTSVGYPGC